MSLKDPELRKAYQSAWQKKNRANQTPEQKEKAKQWSRKWNNKKYAEDPAYRKRAQLRSKVRLYGLTEEGFGELLVEQGGLCALCHEPLYGSKGRSPVIDHDHVTGKVRGILHNNCNIAIGMLQDDAKKLLLAAEYLERS